MEDYSEDIANFVQLLDTSDEEKRKLYNKCKKSDLIEMLICCNNILNNVLEDRAKLLAEQQEQFTIVSQPNYDIN